MTDIDHVPLQPEPPLYQPPQDNRKGRSARWPRAVAMIGVLIGGVALGAGSYALAAAGMDRLGWQRGAHLAFVQGAISRALDSVGASAEQEAKIHDIVAVKFAEIAPNPGDHEAMRKQALDLLAAPTIDRAAVEKLRADFIATFDAKSKTLVSGLLDVADQLTPAQRAQLAVEIAQMPHRGPMMGPWGGEHHGRMMDGGDGGADKD